MESGKRGTRAYFDVDDVNAGAARVRELGGQADEPMAVPSMGWFATCTDPHGNEFGLWQTDPSASAPIRVTDLGKAPFSRRLPPNVTRPARR